MTRLIPINTSYILEKWERQNFVKRKLRVPTASLHEAVELPGKINEFLTQCVESAYHSDNRPILLQSEFGERGTIWKLVKSCQPDAFGISESEGGRRGWKMPLNKKAMVWNAFLRLVAADLNLPLPFVWPEWLIREEFRQSVCSNEREFSYILCKNVFRGQAQHCIFTQATRMDNGTKIHSSWRNHKPAILTLATWGHLGDKCRFHTCCKEYWHEKNFFNVNSLSSEAVKWQQGYIAAGCVSLKA